MVFKRRDRRHPFRIARDFVWPRGGWGRAASYVSHRLRRLPDPPQRIARGIAAGIFVSFSPFFGFHFLYAGLLALVVRGNVIAALLSTLVGNPLTFPVIAATSIQTGEWILNSESPVPLPQVLRAFSQAFGQVKDNIHALVTEGDAHWDRLSVFFEGVFLPYLIGGIVPGLICSVVAYWLAVPLITAYQKRRARAVSGLRKTKRPAN